MMLLTLFNFIALFDIISSSILHSEFTGDGTCINLNFNVQTDKGLKTTTNYFKCSDLLVFNNAEYALCSWENFLSLSIFPGSYGTILPNDYIYVINNTIKSCDKSLTCENGLYLNGFYSRVNYPIIYNNPTIVLSLPESQTYCADLTLDLTKSYGNGGRTWQYKYIQVYQNGMVSDNLEWFLNEDNEHKLEYYPIVIPSTYLVPSVYTFQVIVCNFFGSCGIDMKTVTITNDNTTTIYINMGQDKTIKRNQALEVLTEILLIGCNVSESNYLLWEYNLYGLDGMPYDIKSKSIQMSMYMLDANILNVSTTYIVQLTITNELKKSFKQSINIIVEHGNIYSIISGGNAQTLRIGENKILDGSSSYSEDDENGLDLIYAWNCFTYNSFIGDICDNFGNFNTNSMVSIFSSILVPNITIIELTVSNKYGFSSTSQVQINVVSDTNPIIQISDINTRINTQKSLVLDGFITFFRHSNAIWSVNDTNVILNGTVKFDSDMSLGKSQYVQLIIDANTLPSRSYLSFTLTVEQSFASIVVLTSGSPIPGIFNVFPRNGTELIDQFTLNTGYWISDELPLTYTFGTYSSSNFNIITSGYNSWVKTFLTVADSNNITCSVRAEDIHGASTSLYDYVLVSSVDNNFAENTIINFLNKNTLNQNGKDIQQTVGLGTNVVNRYSCANYNYTDCIYKQELKYKLLAGLEELIEISNANNNLAYFLSNSLSQLSNNSLELSNSSASKILSMVDNILERSNSYDIEHTNIQSILQSVDKSLNVLNEYNNNNNTQIISILENFNKNLLTELVPNQHNENIYDNFQMSSNTFILEENVNLDYPIRKDNTNNSVNSVSVSLLNPTTDSYSINLIVLNRSFFVNKSVDVNNSENLLSEPVYIQTSEPSIINFTLINDLNSPKNLNQIIWFNTTCDGYSPLNETFVCPDGTVLFHRCDLKAGVGIIVSECPVLTKTCGVFNSELNKFLNSSNCKIIDESFEKTVCECNNNIHSNQISHMDKSKSHFSTKSTSYVSNKNTLIIVSMASYLVSDIKNTFLETENLNWNVFNNTKIILSMFGILWGTSYILWACYKIKDKYNYQTKISLARKINNASLINCYGVMKEKIHDYISIILPSIFLELNLFNEIKNNHFYFKILYIWREKNNEQNLFVSLLNITTILSMLIFLMALLYDLQEPTNDGSCVKFLTEKMCLDKKTTFDSSQTYCVWTLDDKCIYNNNTFSFKTMLYIGILVSIFTEIVSKPIDYLFNIIKSPLMKNISVIDNSKKFKETRINNNKIIDNYCITSVACMDIVNNFSVNLLTRTDKKNNKYKLDYNDDTLYDDNDNENDIELKEYNIREAEEVDEAEEYVEVEEAEDNKPIDIEQLHYLINLQRNYINKSDISDYDLAWGIDSFGEFLNVTTNKYKINIKEKINRELILVKTQTKQIIEKLNQATNYDIGTEIIYLFIKDLLGRETPAAKIFEKKFNEENEHMEIVTVTAKRRAYVAVVGLNLFFMYYTLLRGFSKGLKWQYRFLFSCLIQICIEICLFETIECVYINYFVPSMVYKQVNNVYTIVFNLINKMFNHKSDTINNTELLLDAPKHLFISTNVAKYYLNNFESLIVLGYSSCFPGEISKIWYEETKKYYNNYSLWKNILLTVFLLALQLLSSFPFAVQRIIIKFIQPSLLLCGVLIYKLITYNIYTQISSGLLGCGLCIGITYKMYNKKRIHYELR